MKRLTAILCLILLVIAVGNLKAEPIVDTFFITIGPGGDISGGGSGFNGGTWYVYPSGWVNQWFYDHPFDDSRGKIITIEFDLAAVDPAQPSNLSFVVNWSTPEWSYLGYGETTPPTPDLVGLEEDLYIARVELDWWDPVPADNEHFEYQYIIYDYNPEWVSIDVMGENFEITNGIIEHECVDKETDTDNETWGAVKSLYR